MSAKLGAVVPAWGATLSVIYSSEYAAPRATMRAASVLPLLVILFIISYAILTVLVFEQGKTIESQRTLIREMLKDTTQLAALKDKVAQEESQRVAGTASAQTQTAPKGAVAGNPGAGAEKAPKQEMKQPGKTEGKATQSMKAIPGKPAADLEDVRRSTHEI
ncbi:MAG: hypothetical protein WBW53_23255 [Terriglobales bacterium]